MREAADRIRILVIDDRPEDLLGREKPPPWYPEVTSEYRDLFDVRWIATPGEGREFRDLSRRIGALHPGVLGQRGWVPEILVVDYSLTQLPKRVAVRLAEKPELLAKVSPLPTLRDAAAQLGLACAEGEFDGSVTMSEENYGCFLGGLLLSTFSDHPCVPVTSTVRNQTNIEGSYTAYFEWLLADESSQGLRAEGRISGGWTRILTLAAARLRSRIEELACADIVQISLADLLQLAEGKSHQSLTVSSRYGRRNYPVAGLFLDVEARTRNIRAAEWAERILRRAVERPDNAEVGGALFAGTLRDLTRGSELAELLWKAYDDDEEFGRRLRLSELVALQRGAGTVDAQAHRELEDLLNFFGVEDWRKPRAACTRNYIDLLLPDYSDRQRRWAALMVIVRLLECRLRALQMERYTEGGRRNDPVLLAALSPNDVYLALFPIAHVPIVLPWHPEGPDPASSWKNYLSRLCDGEGSASGPGNLALDLQDVIDGKDWEVAGLSGRNRKKSFGVLPHERPVLRMYAVSVGFNRDEWEADPVSVSVLNGRTRVDSEDA